MVGFKIIDMEKALNELKLKNVTHISISASDEVSLPGGEFYKSIKLSPSNLMSITLYLDWSNDNNISLYKAPTMTETKKL